ncbi:hypothetical protein HY631_03685, partial [Candidatus Uhrbacteria bacterium]|nr:hypothetical protein [Candidatus Uhrbacteria bacterium]
MVAKQHAVETTTNTTLPIHPRQPEPLFFLVAGERLAARRVRLGAEAVGPAAEAVGPAAEAVGPAAEAVGPAAEA